MKLVVFYIMSRLNTELGTLQWPITARPHPWPNCTDYFDEAFIFTVEDSTRDDQYFKLHMTTFISLFSLMAYREHLGPPTRSGYSVALMPAVEDYSLQVCIIRYGSLVSPTFCLAGSKGSVTPDYCLPGTVEPGI